MIESGVLGKFLSFERAMKALSTPSGNIMVDNTLHEYELTQNFYIAGLS